MDVLFREARSHNAWLDRPVRDETLRQIWDLMQWGPTSANTPSSSWPRGNPREDPDTPYRRTLPLVTELAETLGVERRVTDYS